MRSLLARLAGLSLAVLLLAACQRTPIYINTPIPGPGVSATPERTAALEAINGRVEARPSSSAEWSTAVRGQTLGAGGQLRTGPDSQAVLRLTEGSSIYVGADTELTLNLLNPYLDSLLTALDLEKGQLWVLLNGGALDVQTPFGIALARDAYLSIDYDPQGRDIAVTCLQGVCGFGSVSIPSSYKLTDAANNNAPEPMSLADFGLWGTTVPETQLAGIATEAVAQGSATVPFVPSATPTPTERPTATPEPSETATPQASDTARPSAATVTPAPPTETRAPTRTPVPSPTLPRQLPTVTRPPFTPQPAAPIIGRHSVQQGETVFCIGRGYGVLPAAIAEANALPAPFRVFTGQELEIPEVQWRNISDGPVCAPQFESPFPGLPVATATPEVSATPTSPLTLKLDYFCVSNCNINAGDYIVRFKLEASGGAEPYTYDPAQAFDLTFPHCTDGAGTVSVTSADGQTASVSWTFRDVACPSP